MSGAIEDVKITSIVVCATLLVYDFFCTFDEEVIYVWMSPWSFGTFLFALNRYLPFADTFMVLNLRTSHSTLEVCHTKNAAVAWLVTIGMMVSEIILIIRTYAMWGRRRWVLILLSIITTIVGTTSIVITYLMIASITYVPQPDNRFGCNASGTSSIIFASYILLVVSETTIVVLTMIKASQHLRESRSSWVLQLYRHGLLFYVYLLVITVGNVVIIIKADAKHKNVLASPQRVLHSILCNRVILLILRHRGLIPHDTLTHTPQFTTIADNLDDLRDLNSEFDASYSRSWMQ